MGDITQSAFSTKEPGVEAPVDTGAASMTTHTNPSFGDRLGSAAGSYMSQHAPVAGTLFNQVFGTGQAPPIQTGTGPAIPAGDDQSAMLQQGMQPPKKSGIGQLLMHLIGA